VDVLCFNVTVFLLLFLESNLPLQGLQRGLLQEIFKMSVKFHFD